MALTFDAGNYITKASALVAAPPITMACWVNFTSSAANAFIMGISSATAAHSSYFAIEMLTASKKIVAAISNDAATADVTAATSTTVSNATWYHVACVFTSATGRTAYLNGAGAVTSAVSITPSTCDTTSVGTIKFNAAVAAGLNGSIAFPAFWNVALTATDIASMAAFFGPLHAHPAALQGYARLTGGNSPEPDLISGSWTLVSG